MTRPLTRLPDESADEVVDKVVGEAVNEVVDSSPPEHCRGLHTSPPERENSRASVFAAGLLPWPPLVSASLVNAIDVALEIKGCVEKKESYRNQFSTCRSYLKKKGLKFQKIQNFKSLRVDVDGRGESHGEEPWRRERTKNSVPVYNGLLRAKLIKTLQYCTVLQRTVLYVIKR